jgi:hypothetical protein
LLPTPVPVSTAVPSDMPTVNVTSSSAGPDSVTPRSAVPAAFSVLVTWSATANVGRATFWSLAVIVTVPVSSAIPPSGGDTAVAFTVNVSSSS